MTIPKVAETFLASQGVTLSHRDTEFDEAKVKRDGRGQFARKAADLSPEELAWLDEDALKELKLELMQSAFDQLDKLFADTLAKLGLTNEADIEKHPKAKAEMWANGAEILNKMAMRDGRSPSGKKRLEFTPSKKLNDFDIKVVSTENDPRIKPNPLAKVSKVNVQEVARRLAAEAGLPEKKSGGLFNPAATITPGGVRDFVAPTRNDNWFTEMVRNLLLHSDIGEEDVSMKPENAAVENFLAHYGVKGMKWGVHKNTSIIGMTDFEVGSTGGAVRTYAKPGATEADHSAVAKATNDIRNHLQDSKAGPFSSNGAGMRISNSYRAKYGDNLPDEAFQSYQKDVAKTLQKEGQSVAPKGAKVLVTTTPEGLIIVVGPPKSVSEFNDNVLKQSMSPDDAIGVLHLRFVLDEGRYISGVVDELQHDDLMVDNFLAHFGIKGMRWGIRRPRGPAGTVSSGTKTTEDDQPGGKRGGSGSRERLSEDAERFLGVQGKRASELSNKEIAEANKRAEAIRKYNDLFGPNPNRELAQKVEALRLEREYRNLKNELYPSNLAKLGRLIGANRKGFAAFMKTKAGEHARKKVDKKLTEIIDMAFNAQAPTPRATTGTRTKKTKTKRQKGAPQATPYGAPTSGATNVTATVTGVRRNTPVYNISSLDSASSPLALPPYQD